MGHDHPERLFAWAGATASWPMRTAGGEWHSLDKGRLIWMSKATVPLTFLRTSDLAAHLAAAVGS